MNVSYLYTRLHDFDCVCKSAAGCGIALGPATFENGSNGAPPSIVSKNSYLNLNADAGPYRCGVPVGFGINSMVMSGPILK